MVKKILNSKYSYLFGLISFILYALSFFIGHDDESSCHLFVLIKISLITVSAVLFLASCNNDSSDRIKTQYCFLCIIILAWQFLLLFTTGKTVIIIRDYPAIVNLLMWIVCPMLSIARFRQNIISCFYRISRDKDFIKLSTASLILALIVIILSAEPDGIRFSWDSDILYGFVYKLDYSSLYDAKQLLFDNHVSIVYFYLAVLFKLLFSDIRVAFFVLNSLCSVAASFGMIFLIRSLVPGRRNVEYMLADVLFMLSPWICGMSTYHIYDYYIYCLFPLLIYFYLEDDTIGFILIGIMISFSRSPGLIAFGSVCAVIFLRDLMNDNNFFTVIKKPKYWFCASIALIFAFYFCLGIDNSMKANDIVMEFNLKHIVHLTKLYLTSNFLWIFSALSFMLIFQLFISKKGCFSGKSKETVIILLVSDLLFFVFYCAFVTYRLPRYMDSHISVLYILGILFLLGLNNRKLSNIVMILLSIVGLISSFHMIDPISMALFQTVNVGNHSIVDFEMTEQPTIEDSIVCNREYYSYEVLLNRALTYVISCKGNNDEVMFSLGDEDNTWGFSCGRYSYSYDENKHYFEEFYDTTINGLANGYDHEYWDSSLMIPFEMHYIFPEETVEKAVEMSNAEVFYYIYIPTLNKNRELQIKENYNITDEKEFSYRGWIMNLIRFSRQS